jgi:hypothetical protein
MGVSWQEEEGGGYKVKKKTPKQPKRSNAFLLPILLFSGVFFPGVFFPRFGFMNFSSFKTHILQKISSS